MCFSATVSFVAGATLSLVGLLSISYAQTLKQRMFAAIPLSFGIQQIAEGIVWKGIEARSDMLVSYGAYTFLFFAFFFWPIWVPLTMRTIESHAKRVLVLNVCLLMGIALGSFLMYQVINYGIFVRLVDCHIMYAVGVNQSYFIPMLIYLLATVVPFFIVLNPRVNLMGIAMAFSYLLTYLFYLTTLVSVWCFFAAIVSFFAVWIIISLAPTDKRKR
jgi:hypothetical protein